MDPNFIVIDGKTYNSVSEMPPEVRAKYEQAMRGLQDDDRDGTPDIFEAAMPAPKTVLSGGMKFVVDGREYNRIEDLPPEARAKYEQAMGALDKNQNGMPDFLEGLLGTIPQAAAPQETPLMQSPRPASRPPQPVSPIGSPDTSNGWMLLLLGGFLMLLCVAGAAGLWYFFLR